MMSDLQALIASEFRNYQIARKGGDSAKAWAALERAHILSQTHLTWHLTSHWEMLKFAVAERDAKECIGQVTRLALAPLGSLTGRIPIGNTGRSNVSAFEPMPIPEDLRDKIGDGSR